MKKYRIIKNKSGFTLVEVIIVLVILAILSAVLIPSLTGYIDEANEKTIITKARQVYVACQTTASEYYAVPVSSKGQADTTDKNTKVNSYWLPITNMGSGPKSTTFKYMKDAYELSEATTMTKFYALAVIEKGKVLTFSYFDVDSDKVAYWKITDNQWEVLDRPNKSNPRQWVLTPSGSYSSEWFSSYYVGTPI